MLKLKTRFLILVLVAVNCTHITAQNFDDLHQELLSENKKYTFHFDSNKIDAALAKCPDIKKYPELLHYKANALMINNQLDVAVKYYQLALKYTPKDSLYLKYNIQYNLCNTYAHLQLYLKSNEYGQKALELAKSIPDKNLELDIKRCLLLNAIEQKEEHAVPNFIAFVKNHPKTNPCIYYGLWIDIINSKQDTKVPIYKEIAYLENQLQQFKNCDEVLMYYYIKQAQFLQQNNKYAQSITYLDSVTAIVPKTAIPAPDKLDIYNTYTTNYLHLKKQDSMYKYENLHQQLLDNVTLKGQQRALLSDIEKTNLSLINTKLTTASNRNIYSFLATLFVFGLAVVFMLRYYVSKTNKLKHTNLETVQKNTQYKKRYIKIWNAYQTNMNQLQKIRKENKAAILKNNFELINNLNSELAKVHYSINPNEDTLFASIEEKYPFLNETEKLICYYKALQLTHKEIAKLLNRTEKSIDSYQYRINTKIKKHKKQIE